MTSVVDKRAREALKQLETYRPGKSPKDVRMRGKAKGRSVIKLASNENALGMSPKAKRALERALKQDLHRYPDATCKELKAKLARKLKVKPESICIGNGSDELLVLALRAFVDPGDEVVVARPTFLIYEIQAQAAGAKIKAVPLKNYRYDLSGMRRAITKKTKLVFIANPDNPTGTYLKASEFEAFISRLPAHVLVVMDEAYFEFVKARDYPKTINYLNTRKILITRSFSKAYGLAGLRVGYGISHPKIIAALEAVREPFNVNSLAQIAACAALEDRRFLEKTLETAAEGRKYLVEKLEALNLRPIPSATNFILVESGKRTKHIVRGLLARGVIVRGMGAWKLNQCFRVSIGTMSENRRFIRELRDVLK